jgi:integrase
MATRKHEGLVFRHSRSCGSRSEAACSCDPTVQAWVYSKRDQKKIRKHFTGKGAVTAAKRWRADALGAVRRGQLRAPTPATVAEAADVWLAGTKDGTIRNRSGHPYRPSAIRGYEASLSLRIRPAIGHLRLSEVRRSDVQELADRLIADGLSPSTVQNTLDPLRAIYRRAVRREEVAVNPCTDLELPKPRGRRTRIASPAEAVRLLNALSDDDRALWATALYAGLRRGELRALRWTDVDLSKREIRVARTWDDAEGEQEGGKTAAAERVVPILAVLEGHLAAHGLRTERDGDALVFGTSDDGPFTPSNVRRRALTAWEAANDATTAAALAEGQDVMPGELLEPIGLHEARHTFASLLIAAGVNAKAITEFMGHSTITMTFDRYGHLMPGGRAEAAEQVDAYLASTA